MAPTPHEPKGTEHVQVRRAYRHSDDPSGSLHACERGGALAFVLGGQWVPAYLLLMTIVVPATFVVIARPWRLRPVLATAAGTLFGPALVLAVPVTLEVFRGEEPAGMLAALFFATMFYFTGLATLVGLLACMALSMLTDEYGHTNGGHASEPS